MAVAPVGPRRIPPAVAVTAGAMLVATVLVGVLVGPASIGAADVLRSMFGWLPWVADAELSSVQENIIYSWRLPRLVLGGLVGAALGMSGAAYQGVFRNPLADPYLLGAAAGAGLGATAAIIVGARSLLPVMAFAGAALAVLAAYGLGRLAGGSLGGPSIILAGVAVAAFLTAVQTYLLQRNSEELQQVYVWILGRLSTDGWGEVVALAPYVVVSGGVIFALRRVLDVMAVGDGEATSLGLPVARVRLLLVGAATLATSAAVAVSGLIGFVGIVVPHLVRLVFGGGYRVVVPLSMVFGAVFLMVADLGARTVMAPAELPIGVVTAFVGAPFFLLVLRRSRRAT